MMYDENHDKANKIQWIKLLISDILLLLLAINSKKSMRTSMFYLVLEFVFICELASNTPLHYAPKGAFILASLCIGRRRRTSLRVLKVTGFREV